MYGRQARQRVKFSRFSFYFFLENIFSNFMEVSPQFCRIGIFFPACEFTNQLLFSFLRERKLPPSVTK